jgi:hypothetical protein
VNDNERQKAAQKHAKRQLKETANQEWAKIRNAEKNQIEGTIRNELATAVVAHGHHASELSIQIVRALAGRSFNDRPFFGLNHGPTGLNECNRDLSPTTKADQSRPSCHCILKQNSV